MSDLISRGTDYADGFADGYNAGVRDAEPKKGRWDVEHGVFMHDNIYGDIYRCSVCGYRERNPEGFNYCPNCGAKMEGGDAE